MEFPVLAFKGQALKAQVHANIPKEHFFTVPGLLTAGEAQSCIDYAESLGFTNQGSRGPAYGEAFRDNGRVSIQSEAIASALWHEAGLSALFKGSSLDGQRPVGLNPNIRFYRYGPGQRFGKHIDDSVELEGGQCTKYTLLVYLSGQGSSSGSAASSSSGAMDGAEAQEGEAHAGSNKRARPEPSSKQAKAGSKGKKGGAQGEGQQAGQRQQQEAEVCTRAVQDLVGGETVFYGSKGKLLASVTPQPGLALLHLHGEDRCLEHEARAVQQGYKYVLRSDVVYS